MKLIRSFECKIEDFSPGWDLVETVMAFTASQARYSFWRQKSEVLNTYSETFRWIKVRTLGRTKPSDFFMDKFDFDRMCEHRNLQFAYQGMEIDVNGKRGIIVGAISFNLEVMFEGSFKPDANCHPHWETTYFGPTGEIIADFKQPAQ